MNQKAAQTSGISTDFSGVLDADLRAATERNFRELSAIEGNILNAAGGRDIRSLLITSCAPKDGKTTSAIGMAVTMANEPYNRVLLVDGNLHNPSIHRMFRLNQYPGLSDVVLAGLKSDQVGESSQGFGPEVFQSTEYDNLSVLTAGSAVKNSLEVFRSPNFISFFERIKGEFTHVIFDSTSFLGHSDVAIISKQFDGVLLVISSGKSKQQVINLVKDRMLGVGGNLLGIVMNRRKYYIPSWAYRFL
ncbi:MAG: CpsD/CapB family tyrosine-protein kinase [Magnetococcales bacterium]|nr:CpsD/CapB family tyrosine-protein kinase [Magnetococcales bacterium]